MVNTLDAFANALCCDSIEGLECILHYHYRKLKFLHKLVSSQAKFIEEITSDYDSNTSLDVKLVMSDNKAAKKLHKMINLAIDDHDIDGYDLILMINGNEIMLIIDCDEI